MQHSNKIKSHKKYSTQTKYNHFQMQHLNKIHFQTHNNAAAALKQLPSHKNAALKQNTLYNHVKMQHSNKKQSHKNAALKQNTIT